MRKATLAPFFNFIQIFAEGGGATHEDCLDVS